MPDRPATAGPLPTTAPSTGAFLYHPYLTSSEINALLNEWLSLGITEIAVSETREKRGAASTGLNCDTAGGASYTWIDASTQRKVGELLTAAQARGMHVYIGVTASSAACTEWWLPPNRMQDTSDVDMNVQYWLAHYGTNTALAGWYITNEQALAYGHDPTTLAEQAAYFHAIRNAIRARDATRPIFVAPYLGNYAGGAPQSPQGVGANAASFDADSGGDLIQMWQDSTGAFGVSIGWQRDIPGDYTVAEMFAGISAHVAASQLWSDNELFAYPPTPDPPGYTAAPLCRVVRQLAMSRSATKHFLWLPQAHMTGTTPAMAPHVGAARLMAAYRAFFGFGGEYVRPPSYHYTIGVPLDSQPDATGLLTDFWPGDPTNWRDSHWVGLAPGTVEISVDMGSTKLLQWGGVHCLNATAQGIAFPDSVQILTSPDGTTYTSRGTWDLPGTRGDAELVLANSTALAVPCRFVKLRLENTAGKTWIAELELIAA